MYIKHYILNVHLLIRFGLKWESLDCSPFLVNRFVPFRYKALQDLNTLCSILFPARQGHKHRLCYCLPRFVLLSTEANNLSPLHSRRSLAQTLGQSAALSPSPVPRCYARKPKAQLHPDSLAQHPLCIGQKLNNNRLGAKK